MTAVRYKADHPLRPVHWRWERARIIREMGRRARRLDDGDPWVRRCVRLQESLDSCRDELDRSSVLDDAGALGVAYDVWDSDSGRGGGYDKSNYARHELEARLLARQLPEEIAGKLAIDQTVILAYERVFFNVSDRLANVGYVVHQVLGPDLHRGTSDRHVTMLWKAYGYFSESGELLDALITTFHHDGGKVGTKDIESFLAADSQFSNRRKAAFAARMLPLNSYTQERILDMQTKLRAIEMGREGDAAPIVDNSKQIVQMVLGALPWKPGRRVDDVAIVNGLSYDGKPAELRAEELAAVAMGDSGPQPDNFGKFEPAKIEPVVK